MFSECLMKAVCQVTQSLPHCVVTGEGNNVAGEDELMCLWP